MGPPLGALFRTIVTCARSFPTNKTGIACIVDAGWTDADQKDMKSLENQTAIVTGASRGYGKGIAQALTHAGARVWITGRNAETLENAARETGATPFVADVNDGAAWDRLISEVTGARDRLDILINNAGEGVSIAPLTEQSDEAIERSLATNLTGAILGCRRAAAVMVGQQSGLIVNIGSVCAKHAWGEWSVYSAAKAGLLQFTRCLLTELRPSGVRVTSVIPSWGQTEFTDSCGLGARESGILEKCIAPEELGKLIVQIAERPAHLVTEEVTLWPMVQPISQL